MSFVSIIYVFNTSISVYRAQHTHRKKKAIKKDEKDVFFRSFRMLSAGCKLQNALHQKYTKKRTKNETPRKQASKLRNILI